MCHTSHTLTLDCCDAVDESTPDVLGVETVDTSCVATVGSLGVANVNTSGLITVGSSGVVTLSGVMFGVLLPPAAHTWSVGLFAVISGDSTVCHNTLIVCHSDFPALLGNTCMHGVDYIKHDV